MPYTWNWISAMRVPSWKSWSQYYHSAAVAPARGGAASGSDSGQCGLVARGLDSLQLRLHPVEPGGRLVVLVAGIGQVLAHYVEGVPELVHVAPQARQARLDLPRVLL